MSKCCAEFAEDKKRVPANGLWWVGILAENEGIYW